MRCPYLEHALATRKGGRSLPEGPVAALLGASSWQWEWPEMQSASSTRQTSRGRAQAALTRVLPSLHERQRTDRTILGDVWLALRTNERQLTASRAS